VPHCCLFNVKKIIKFQKERHEAVKPFTFFLEEKKFPDHRFPSYIINIRDADTLQQDQEKNKKDASNNIKRKER
jgi:hypothetical protein